MSDPYDEPYVVLLAQCGVQAAFETLLINVRPALSRYVSGLVGDAEADDVLQDVFVTIWRNLKWLRRPELFRPWAYRIATHASYRHLKRAKRWSDRIDEAVALDGLPASQSWREEVAGGLDALLKRVSPASRALLLLHYVEDLSIHEAAAILDISVGTAKSRLAYGLKCLRELTKSKG
jgi:RNA polymerase sigma-70 factor (ECF subfamily)